MNALARKRGFTLVELIVVIAIVAILAAVSIVGYQSYIGKARLSNDVTDAKNMTSVLQNYMTLNNLDDVDPAEIRAIVNIDNDYSFIPRADGYSFWYDETTRTIEVKSTYEAMSGNGDFTELTGSEPETKLLSNDGTQLAGPNTGDALEEVVAGFYLLDISGSPLAEAINGIRNLKTFEDYQRIVGEGDFVGEGELDAYTVVKTHITTNFNPDDTLFINDFFGFTSSGNLDVETIIFSDFIESIPGAALASVTDVPTVIRLPVSVTVIEEGAFHTLPLGTQLIYDDISRIRVEERAFNPDDTLNGALIAKEGSVVIRELQTIFRYDKVTTKYYSHDVGTGRYTLLGKSDSVSDPSMNQMTFLKLGRQVGSGSPTWAIDYDESIHDGYFTYTASGNVWTIYLESQDFVPITISRAWWSNYGLNYLAILEVIKYESVEFRENDNDNYTLLGKIVQSSTEYHFDISNWKYTAPNHELWFEQYGFMYAYLIDTLDETLTYYDGDNNVIVPTGFIDDDDYLPLGTPYSSLFGAAYQTKIWDGTVKVSLGETPDLVLSGFDVTYREHNGIVICEVKGYDASGRLIAKGTARIVRMYLETHGHTIEGS
jgi:prepilin-type N-terminal cleavage/methylation domain-containing protein